MSNQVEVRYVVVEPKAKTNHILHLLLSLITLGLWLPVWFLVSLKTNLSNVKHDTRGYRVFRIAMAIIAGAYVYHKMGGVS